MKFGSNVASMKTVRTAKEFGDAVEQAADTGKVVTAHVQGPPRPAPTPEKKTVGEKINELISPIVNALKSSPPNTLHVLARKFETLIGHPLLSKSDFQALTSAHKEWKAAWIEKNVTYTPHAAREAYRQDLSRMSSGEAPDPVGLDRALDEFAARSAGAVERMRKINAATLPVVRRALENFVEAGQFWIIDRLAAEKSEASDFGVTFAPSNQLMAAQRAVATAKIQLQNLAPGGQSNPLAYLQFLDIE